MKFTNWTRNVWKKKKGKIHNKQKRPSLHPEGKGRLNLRASYCPERHLISPGTARWELSLSAAASVSEAAAAEQKDQNPQTAVIAASVIAVTAKETAVATAVQKNQNPDQAAASASMIMIVKRTSAATVGCC